MIRFLLFMVIILSLFIGGRGIEIKAAHAEDYGIIQKQTRLYSGPSSNSLDIGEIEQGERVDIVSILSEYDIIQYKEQYAYVSKYDINIDNNFVDYLGQKVDSNSPYDFILTEGKIYQNSLQKLIDAYLAVPFPIREKFEREGFLIIMTEKDITKMAYAPYGGYWGIGQVKSAIDYERKLLFVNDEWPTSIIHEMGHYLNDTLNGISSRPENQEAYREESEKISQYGMSNGREFFAEAFRLYVTHPKFLALLSKPSYEIVEQAIKEIG